MLHDGSGGIIVDLKSFQNTDIGPPIWSRTEPGKMGGDQLYREGDIRKHEWKLWEDIDLAEGKTIIPGVITHSSVLVEHPELVAERLLRFASVVGKENVMAGGDCGCGSQAMAEPEVHPTIVWAKFAAMVEGAKIASKELWG